MQCCVQYWLSESTSICTHYTLTLQEFQFIVRRGIAQKRTKLSKIVHEIVMVWFADGLVTYTRQPQPGLSRRLATVTGRAGRGPGRAAVRVTSPPVGFGHWHCLRRRVAPPARRRL